MFLRPEITCLLCRDRPENYLLNGIMMTVPKNEFILNLIFETVKNSLNGKYKKEWEIKTVYGEHGIYSISGPRLCGVELMKYLDINKIDKKTYNKNNEIYDLIMKFDIRTPFGNWNDYNIYYNEQIIMLKNYIGYYQNTIRDGYISMYRQKRVFMNSNIIPKFTDKNELLLNKV